MQTGDALLEGELQLGSHIPNDERSRRSNVHESQVKPLGPCATPGDGAVGENLGVLSAPSLLGLDVIE